jgi:hypothetical protein
MAFLSIFIFSPPLSCQNPEFVARTLIHLPIEPSRPKPRDRYLPHFGPAGPIPVDDRASLTQYPHPAKAVIAFAGAGPLLRPAAKSPSQIRARNPSRAIAPGRVARAPRVPRAEITPLAIDGFIDSRDPVFRHTLSRGIPRRIFALQFLCRSFS